MKVREADGTPFAAQGEPALRNGGRSKKAMRSLDRVMPQDKENVEIEMLCVVMWLAVCVTAGFCEEMIFRGYLQRQFLAMSGSVTAAVVGQALFFGVGHVYQGWKQVAIIVVLGVLYGALAWRRDLRANIIAHTWSDVWEGWLKFLLFL
jgi:membrane protease YdiL (CAAX protease family)